MATRGIQHGLPEEREEIPKRLVDSFADVVELTRCETTIWLADGLPDLPTILSKKGRIRKSTKEYKMAAFCAINMDRKLTSTNAALVGIQLWERKMTLSKVCRDLRTQAPFASASMGVACGQGTIYHDFLSPATDDSTWAPEVEQGLSESGGNVCFA